MALLAPFAFKGYWELPIVTTLSALAVAAAYRRAGAVPSARSWQGAGLSLVILSLAGFTVFRVASLDPGTLARSRNFYGVLKVLASRDATGPMLYLVNGRVSHGFQYTDPVWQRFPTSYYSPGSGVGLALRHHPRRASDDPSRRGLRVGVIGLGTGTLAVYGRKGDTFRFYEINNDVIRLADRYFSYRRDSEAVIETVPGDARIALESEQGRRERQRFDVLAVDAFTSDSIPVHLLTRECFELYRYHLEPDGLLLIHVTNHFLDLVPVVRAHARRMGLAAVTVRSSGKERGSAESTWMIVTANRDFLERVEVRSRLAGEGGEQRALREWTDDFASLWQVLKW